MLLVFELFLLPICTPRFGIRLCQRLGSVVEVPLYIIFPLISYMSSTGYLIQAAAAILLFLAMAASDPVGGYPFVAYIYKGKPKRKGHSGLCMAVTGQWKIATYVRTESKTSRCVVQSVKRPDIMKEGNKIER